MAALDDQVHLTSLPACVVERVLWTAGLHAVRCIASASVLVSEGTKGKELWMRLYRSMWGGPSSNAEAPTTWRDHVAMASRITSKSRPFPQVLDAQQGGFELMRAGHSAFMLGGQILLLFGATEQFDYRNDAALCKWTVGSADPFFQASNLGICTTRLPNGNSRPIAARWLHTASIVGSDLVVVGGQTHHRVLSEVLKMRVHDGPILAWWDGTFESHTPVGELTQADMLVRDVGFAGHSATVHNDNGIILFGGVNLDMCATNSLSLFDVQRCRLSRLEPTGKAPEARWCHSCVMVCDRSRAFAFGGWAYPESRFFADLHTLDMDPLNWSLVVVGGQVPRGRCQATLLEFEMSSAPYLLLFGGACHSEEHSSAPYGDRVVDLADFHVYDMKTSTWLCSEIDYAPLRGGTNAAVHNEREVFICGGMHSDSGVNSPTFVSDCLAISLLP